MERYANTADYIRRALLGRPEGFEVFLTAADCRLIYILLSHAVVDSGDEHLHSLHRRFGKQWKSKITST